MKMPVSAIMLYSFFALIGITIAAFFIHLYRQQQAVVRALAQKLNMIKTGYLTISTRHSSEQFFV